MSSRSHDAEPSEHVRFHGYLRALSEVTDDSERNLLGSILDDLDQVMAESAVIRHMDRKADALGDGDAFAQWSRRVAPALEGHELPARRLREWLLAYAISADRPWNTVDLAESSDWLQREIAERSDSPEALTTLADHGRTKRVRNSARSRLAQHNQ